MPATAPQSFRQELYAAHVLVMQCGARAEQFLDRAGAPVREPRAEAEALRMAALTSRLMENVHRGMTLAQSGRAPTSIPAAPTSAAAIRDREGGKLHAAPDSPRGRLKNGNPSGDYLRAPRCGARTRAGCPCRQPAMPNGRCRLHGGLSTGPRTAEGRRRSQTARRVHGYRSAELIGLRARAVHAARRLRALTTRPAGHGVHRPESVGARCARPSATLGVPSTNDVRLDDPRACAARPYNTAAGRPLSAWHGVDRSNPISRGWKAAVRWLLEGKEGAQARRQTIAVPGWSGFAPM
ncbi:MAG TPA: HGGxSTG domain-containing protein [Methylomirabilota bacterium]|nr:HGGxSTG domain-containing protein [Methylomirabilota bacterium]